jgi:hypothetical protein
VLKSAPMSLALCIVSVVTLGCVQRPSRVAALEIARAAAPFMTLCGTSQVVERSRWPGSFQRHDVRSVNLREPGLYVETSRAFADEAGVFVPCDASAFAPVPYDWPRYSKVGDGVFTYYYSG